MTPKSERTHSVEELTPGHRGWSVVCQGRMMKDLQVVERSLGFMNGALGALGQKEGQGQICIL